MSHLYAKVRDAVGCAGAALFFPVLIAVGLAALGGTLFVLVYCARLAWRLGGGQ